MEESHPSWDPVSLPHDDVRRIWLRFSHAKPDYGDPAFPPFVFEPTYIELNPEYHATMESETLPRLATLLLEGAGNSQNHIQLLNHAMGAKILCTFDRCLSQTVGKALDLLSRLPRYPLDIPFDQIVGNDHVYLTRAISGDYLVLDQPSGGEISRTCLKVVSLIDGCTMRIALAIAERPTPSLCYTIKRFLDIIAKMVDIVLEATTEQSRDLSSSTLITFQYLWTMWHRSVTLYLSALLTIAAWLDSVQLGELLALSFPNLLGRPAIRDAWRGLPAQRSPYMCSWAFELLGASRGSLAFDFRLFHRRFIEAFPKAQPRCTISNQTCNGGSPESCGRFNCKELVRGDQSLHDVGCRGCGRLVWDKNSYLKVQGGRAVDISYRSSSIKYCNAGGSTIAISHVWSHGQGGRPDTGINECLHVRYLRMAKDNNCSSYWIDTVCIPNDHDLRSEAIHHINDTFSQSKITLVCDRDLSSMPAPSGDRDIAQAERLLVTLLVCDWNVRAWTLLEALRGSHNIHIVCAENKLVSVSEIVQLILQKGNLDIAVLALTMQHLREKTNVRLKVMDASAMLSYRYATRPGDDVVIWSLICSIRASHISSNPEVFWKSKIGFFINTGYLMSTAPRLQGVEGFSWAPRTPNVRSTDPLLPVSYPSDGSGSEVGKIVRNGLEAIWLCHQVEDGDSEKFSGSRNNDFSMVIQHGHRAHRLNRCWLEVQRLQSLHARVCLLVAKSQSFGRYYTAEESQKDYILVAVAFSNEKVSKDSDTYEDTWTWSGAHQWPSIIPMPQMEWERILLT